MESTIIKIGNSKGLIIPSKILNKLKITAKSLVDVVIKEGSIVITPSARQDWEKAAKECHKKGDDKMIMPDVFNDENILTW
jgi:antitoxin MazE